MEIDRRLHTAGLYAANMDVLVQECPDYDLIDPAYYDGRARLSGGYYIAETIGALFQRHLPLTKPPQKILDIGAGTGIISQYLQNRLGYQVVATDLSQKMLDYLHHGNLKIQTQTGDMNGQLPFCPSSFEGITTNWANRFVIGDNIAREAYRLLKPGKIFIWPFAQNERNIWKSLAGEKQPTQAREFKKILQKIGFSTELFKKPMPKQFANHHIAYPCEFLIATKK